MNCVFCSIVNGTEPARKIAQTDKFIAILDIAPAAPGDTIIIPRKHTTDLLDFPEEDGKELFSFIQRVANTILAVTHSDAFNLVSNSGAAAGQQIYHTHLHIIPRKKDDKLVMPIGSHRVVSSKDLDKQQKEFMRLY